MKKKTLTVRGLPTNVRPKPPVDSFVRSMHDLEGEMAKTLQREDVSEDEKMTLYDQNLQKYMSRYQQYKQDGVQPMVVTTPKKDLTHELVLKSVPKTAHSKTEMLMDRLKQVVDWNDRGEFGYKGQPVIPGSNLVDLVGNATRQRSLKNVNPEGTNTFLTALRDVNVPQSWISNKSYLERMQNVASTPLPLLTTSRTPTPTSRIAFSQTNAAAPQALTPTPQDITSSPEDNEEESGYSTFSTPISRSTIPRRPVSDRLLKGWNKYKPSE